MESYMMFRPHVFLPIYIPVKGLESYTPMEYGVKFICNSFNKIGNNHRNDKCLPYFFVGNNILVNGIYFWGPEYNYMP